MGGGKARVAKVHDTTGGWAGEALIRVSVKRESLLSEARPEAGGLRGVSWGGGGSAVH